MTDTTATSTTTSFPSMDVSTREQWDRIAA